MPGCPTIVVVDDAAEVRALVRARLRLSRRLDVVGEGADGAAAVELAREHQPALLLLDVSMPGTDGLEALPLVRRASPETRVVMYSGFSEDGLAARTRDLGAAAFLEKSTSLDTLADDLLQVLDGSVGAPIPVPRADPAETERAAVEAVDAAERAVLHEHLERFREVFEDAAIGMATMTLSGRVVRANRSLAQLLVRPVDALVGAAYPDLLHDPGPFRRALGRVLDGGEDAVQVEHRVAGLDERRLLATLSPVRDSRQRPLYLFLQVQDVSRQRRAEEALRQSEQRFRLLVDAVQDYAIFMLDPDGHIASWNAGAQRAKGYTAAEILGQHFRVFYPPELQQSRHPEHELELAIRDGRYEEEGWRIRKDGSRFWAQVTITAVHDELGRLVGFAKVTRDTSERRRMLDELAEANQQLRRTADDQAHFLAVTAHELRAPVGVLGMTAETLSRHWADLERAERDDFLASMATSAGQLRRLLGDLLTAARLDASALDLNPVRVPLADRLSAVVAGARSTHPGAVLEFDPEGVARDVAVLADPGRLVQAVDNLVLNALRHGASPVRIDVEAHRRTVDVVVRDAGPGVHVDMLPRLFDRFATSSSGGTGLGLFIVRELCRAQGGDAFYRAEDRAFVASFPRHREEP
ncbi:PAS domain S-box protein [Nocardioides ferulae]|uniref:PAS domain S-box protein n=1 Tax=Nocardioides ferulae TaxID=2340821 RepID=UPI001F0BABA6|nr:PAS domain S-box protein [Nocardioides ferulae]